MDQKQMRKYFLIFFFFSITLWHSATVPAKDPGDLDTDGDGIHNGLEETRFFTDPLTCDTDGDGLGDGL